jgi:hypothetical protein
LFTLKRPGAFADGLLVEELFFPLNESLFALESLLANELLLALGLLGEAFAYASDFVFEIAVKDDAFSI